MNPQNFQDKMKNIIIAFCAWLLLSAFLYADFSIVFADFNIKTWTMDGRVMLALAEVMPLLLATAMYAGLSTKKQKPS